jgi:hypothetical protein
MSSTVEPIMNLLHLATAWIEATAVATAIRESEWLFPSIETLHVLSIVLVVGTIGMVDLRLLNVMARDRAVSEVLYDTLPWTRKAFAVALVSGLLLFSANADRYISGFPFPAKMALMAVAGVNMAVFHLFTQRSIAEWDRARVVPVSVKAAGGVSLMVWIGIVFLGRWIGFT